MDLEDFVIFFKKKGDDGVTLRQGSGHWRNAKGKERGKLGDWLAKRKKYGKDSEFVP